MQFARKWRELAGDAKPLGADLRKLFPDRWVRYYTLPGGERIPQTDEQWGVVLRRYLTVLATLGDPEFLVVDGVAQPVADLSDLVPILEAVADDRLHDVIIAPADLRWLFHPYDGGMDVIGGEADFPEWRSPRPDGL